MEPSTNDMSHPRFAKTLAIAKHAIDASAGEGSLSILPRESLPSGFGSKVAFQTVRSKNAKEGTRLENISRQGTM